MGGWEGGGGEGVTFLNEYIHMEGIKGRRGYDQLATVLLIRVSTWSEHQYHTEEMVAPKKTPGHG